MSRARAAVQVALHYSQSCRRHVSLRTQCHPARADSWSIAESELTARTISPEAIMCRATGGGWAMDRYLCEPLSFPISRCGMDVRSGTVWT